MSPTSLRVEESINGQQYRIDVTMIGHGRWRAQVMSAYGGPSALMPFYGATPEAAVRALSVWLDRAHRTAAGEQLS